MGCCRAKHVPRVSMPQRTRMVTVCVSCRASIRDRVTSELRVLSAKHTERGRHTGTVQVVCACGYLNRVGVTWVKR